VEGATMSEPEYPLLAKLVFRDLDGGDPVTVDELPAGVDVDTYAWVREVVRRLRESLQRERNRKAFQH
jgi:hypothetical protein